MKFLYLFPILLLIYITGCREAAEPVSLIKEIEKEISSGNLTLAMHDADSLKSSSGNDRKIFLKADSLYEIARRIKIDFSLTPEEALASIGENPGEIKNDQIEKWEQKGWLESRIIDGQKMYFNRAVSNLFLLRDFYEKSASESIEDEEAFSRKTHTAEVIKASSHSGKIVEPKKIGIIYTITVEKDAVPENEIIRCWLPWPKSTHSRQGNIRLLKISQPEYSISPDTSIHSTLFMQKKSEKGIPTVFSIEFEYETSAQWFEPDSILYIPYNKESDLYKKYTSEQLPHINFSSDVRMLADSICGNEMNPVECAFRIWRWFKKNIPWTGAIEYSVLPDITSYCISHMRGDCGIQTMTFMSMLRYKGIPVRWQSGWKIPPYGKNLHDWCEVYFEGTGWVPVDVSYDLQNTEDAKLRDFFMSGIDSYRLIINDGIAGTLWPIKEYLRSEPYDFQRGEVEWKNGNIYFDKWDYEMKIVYK
ncbi:MAG TPA: transglutaminase-like domain-containing protein [Bacteroidales bacterium]|nr:transglutaminase-like domain-containing protein [Bacteroidales bacterium]